MSDLLHQVEALCEIRGQQPQSVNNNNSNTNVRLPTNVTGTATLNNASAKQNNVTREAQAQVQTSTSNIAGACAAIPPTSAAHSAYNNISSVSACSSSQQQSKDNRVAFCGIKKGFLENMTNNPRDVSNKDKRTNETKNLSECNQIGSKKTYNKDMPFIKPKNTDGRSASFELHEELENIREKQTLFNNTDWVTENLLQRIQSNPNLSGRLSDPQFIQALTEFQQNPQAAIAKYQDDQQLQGAMQQFCNILGDHFLKLDKKDGTHKPSNLEMAALPVEAAAVSSASASLTTMSLPNQQASAYMENEHRIQDLLTDPEIREALVDKKVQELIAMQNRNPERAQSMLHQGDSELRKKVKKLVEAGLLSFNT